ASEHAGCRLHAREQALRRRFLVTGGAVDLARTIETGDSPKLQVGPKCARIDVIVLDRVAGHLDLDPLESCHRPQKAQLNIGRERGADTVGIDGVSGQSLGLEENLVALAVGEAMNLVLDRRAIAGTCRSD